VRRAQGESPINGNTHPVEILIKDSQSSSNRAADVASDPFL
jgi:hypothetical protein